MRHSARLPARLAAGAVGAAGAVVTLAACSVVPAQPPLDLANRSREEPIYCDDCGTPFLQTLHYKVGQAALTVTFSEKKDETKNARGTRKSERLSRRIEVTTASGFRLVSNCVDEYSWTQPSSSVLAEDIVDSYSCVSDAATEPSHSVVLRRADSEIYEGEIVLGGERYGLHSLRDSVDGSPGNVRGFAISKGETSLAAWRSQRGGGPELLWLGQGPAPTDGELALFLTTLFFHPGNLPL